MVHKQQDETKMDSLEVLTSETKKKMKVKSWYYFLGYLEIKEH